MGESRKRAQPLSTLITVRVSDWPTPDSLQAKLNTDWLLVVAAELCYSSPSNTGFRQGAGGTICLSTLGSDTDQSTPCPKQWQRPLSDSLLGTPRQSGDFLWEGARGPINEWLSHRSF